MHRALTSDPQRNAMHRAAYAGGMDFRSEFANRGWVVNGDVELSRVEGSTGAIIAKGVPGSGDRIAPAADEATIHVPDPREPLKE